MTTILRNTFVVCAMLALSLSGKAAAPKLDAAQVRLLQDSSRLNAIASAADLPAAARKLCADHDGRLAWGGEAFNPTCVGGDGSPPSTRLLWAMRSQPDKLLVLHVERGGIAHMFYTLLVHLEADGEQAQLRWSASGKPLKDYAAFLDALKAGALTDSPWR